MKPKSYWAICVHCWRFRHSRFLEDHSRGVICKVYEPCEAHKRAVLALEALERL